MKIAVFGNYGVQNLGDDLILRGLLEMHHGDEVIVFCGQLERVQQQFGLESYSFFPGGLRSGFKYLLSSRERAKIRKAYQVLKNVDKILIGGGGILVDHHLKAVVLWWNQLRMIRKTRVPYSFVANSIELRSARSRKIFLPFFQSAESISVRDRSSQRLLADLGVKSDLVEDLSFNVPLALPVRQPKKQIALALCRWGLGEAQLRALRQFISKKRAEGYEFVGLAFQTLGDDDRNIFQELDPTLVVKTGADDILECLRQSEAVIAIRYHAVLLAYRLKVPLLALSYQQKVSSFMHDRDLASACVPIQKIDEQNIQELFRNAVEATSK